MSGEIDVLVSGWRDIVLSLIMVGITFYIVLMIYISMLHLEIERKLRSIPERMKDIESNLKTVGFGLSRENADIRGREKEQVVEEAKKISQLWKSRREMLQMGYWDKMEAKADELTKLQTQKDHLEELIKRTKIKYHKRELDEESFREIVKDYQKQLMEINVKIWELEKSMD
jgi:hypothetical protein